MKQPSLILIICTLFLGCIKDKPEPVQVPPPPAGFPWVFIANEGSLGNGNATLSVYDPETGNAFHQVFKEKNGRGLGDVLQSIAGMDDRLFLAMNNSDRIIVMDKGDFSLLGAISVRKPRYMLALGMEKMYVSSLFYPEINIVNPSTFEHLGKITLDYPNTEGLLLLDGYVYACNWDTACNYIYKIDPLSDQIMGRIPLSGYAPQAIVADKNNKLWVLAGNVAKNCRASLTQVDPATGAILKSLPFPDGAEMIKPAMNRTKDTIYFLGVNYEGAADYNGLYRMDINANSLPEAPFIAAQPLQYFWGLGIDPVKNQIYLGDPLGFIQQGVVSVYSTEGTLLDRFNTGLGPGFFYFEQK